jgi:4a-hydroxytetrahydrobiopterin dehydratase
MTAAGDEQSADRTLSRTDASAAVDSIGWRYLVGNLAASVPVASLQQAVVVAAAAARACGELADGHLHIDLRPDRVELSLRDRTRDMATSRDTELAHAITAALTALGLAIGAPVSSRYSRPVQMLEIAIDALNIGAIMPFWKAVLGYADEPVAGEPGAGDPGDAIVDPAGQLPSFWFQEMDAPRPQRNRIHLDIAVSHEEAEPRITAALAAGGTLVYDEEARAFWVLADAEGNEVCVCTWQDRDRPA